MSLAVWIRVCATSACLFSVNTRAFFSCKYTLWRQPRRHRVVDAHSLCSSSPALRRTRRSYATSSSFTFASPNQNVGGGTCTVATCLLCPRPEWWGVGMVICLERGADLHMFQMMPLPLTVSCFSKIQIGFSFLVPAHLGSPGERAVKRVCVCLHHNAATSIHLCEVTKSIKITANDRTNSLTSYLPGPPHLNTELSVNTQH